MNTIKSEEKKKKQKNIFEKKYSSSEVRTRSARVTNQRIYHWAMTSYACRVQVLFTWIQLTAKKQHKLKQTALFYSKIVGSRELQVQINKIRPNNSYGIQFSLRYLSPAHDLKAVRCAHTNAPKSEQADCFPEWNLAVHDKITSLFTLFLKKPFHF